MNHRAAVPLLKTAQAGWRSDSRWGTYLAVVVGAGGLFLLVREVWRLKAIWSDKN